MLASSSMRSGVVPSLNVDGCVFLAHCLLPARAPAGAGVFSYQIVSCNALGGDEERATCRCVRVLAVLWSGVAMVGCRSWCGDVSSSCVGGNMVVCIYDLSRRAVSWPCHSVSSCHADLYSSLPSGCCTLRLFFTLLRSRAVACNSAILPVFQPRLRLRFAAFVPFAPARARSPLHSFALLSLVLP
jgi:hypothetical protein